MSDNMLPGGEPQRGKTFFNMDETFATRSFFKKRALRSEPGWHRQQTGGARRDRTDGLLLAKQALSQLSYGPRLRIHKSIIEHRYRFCAVMPDAKDGGPGKI